MITPVRDLASLQLSSLVISHLCFFISLIGFWKLLNLDFEKNTAKIIILSLLLFPTSFYFVSTYTESLFFATVVWSFYLARKESWFTSGIVGALSSATRIVGMGLIPAFLFEGFYFKRRKNILNLVLIFAVSMGFLGFVYYSWKSTGNPLEFNRGSELFGAYRSQEPLILPRIFYRYIFKILPNLTWSYFPVTFTTVLEFASGIILTTASIVGFFKLRFSYWIFLMAGFIMPSMYNGFVSLPRYSAVLFPLFILFGIYIKDRKYLRYAYFLVCAIALCAATILFTRGYWIS